MTSETPGDLNGFVEQLEAQRETVAADLAQLLTHKATVGKAIKAKRLEQSKLERLWRATQPRGSKTP